MQNLNPDTSSAYVEHCVLPWLPSKAVGVLSKTLTVIISIVVISAFVRIQCIWSRSVTYSPKRSQHFRFFIVARNVSFQLMIWIPNATERVHHDDFACQLPRSLQSVSNLYFCVEKKFLILLGYRFFFSRFDFYRAFLCFCSNHPTRSAYMIRMTSWFF